MAEPQEELHRAVEEYPSYRSFRCIVLVSLCETGQFDEARRLFDRLAVDSFGRLPKDNEWLSNMTLLTEATEALDDRARAATLYDLLGPYAGQVALVASDVSLGPRPSAPRHPCDLDRPAHRRPSTFRGVGRNVRADGGPALAGP